jgi:Rap1a immunity proteins
MKIAAVFFLFVLPLAPAVTSPGQSNQDSGMVGFGNQFYDRCASVDTFFAENKQPETLSAMFCLGYMEGLTQGIMAADLRQASQTFCLPSPEVTNQQFVRVVRKYISDHPERAHELTAVLAVESPRKAFPCKN